MTTPEAALAAAIGGAAWGYDFRDADATKTGRGLAPETLRVLHEAGWVLTPLAPEVPPRPEFGPCPTRGADNPSRRPWHYAHAAGIEGLHWDIYAGEGVDGWLVASVGTEADAALIVENVNRTPEPPDSGPDRKGFSATYDPEAKAVYVYLTSQHHAETVEVTDDVNVDLDEHGHPIGVEILNVHRAEPPDSGDGAAPIDAKTRPAPPSPSRRRRTPMRETAPPWEPPVVGETSREARQRRERNRAARKWWEQRMDARCADCGQVRFHVSHELDPETSPEGPEYHADFGHHPFVEPVR